MTDRTETAYLAGGCAWIMQHLLRTPDGVLSTHTGWMGGTGDHPTEDSPGGHAEVVQVVFDPDRLSFRQLLEVFFLTHRPDLREEVVGSIYRSEIFCTSEAQRAEALATVRDVDASHHWLGSTVTRVSDAGTFWAEGPEQQDYLLRFPQGCPPPFPRQRSVSVTV
jgi:peptide-methionine (S)-S-oxide reductase